MKHNQERGLSAENFFASKMNALGLKFSFENDWFDFLVNENKVEVKSCELSVKQRINKKRTIYRCGRFDFTKKETRELQYNENIWVCFIMRHVEDFLMLGFVKARELNKKRYVPLQTLYKLKIIPLSEWVKLI